METELQVLVERITVLEELLGPPPTSPSPCLHRRIRAAHRDLCKIVPDEMAAAYRAVQLLSHVTPSLRSLRYARRARAARAEEVVDRVATALAEMEVLSDEGQVDGSSLRIDRRLGDELQDLQSRISEQISPAVQEEEQAMDDLLMKFNEATNHLNDRILSLADAVRKATAGEV